MFKHLPEAEVETLHLVFDGAEITARRGASLAEALLAAGIARFREGPDGAPRGPYCLMGVCFECLVTVDGRDNRQACMIEVRDGMRVSSAKRPQA